MYEENKKTYDLFKYNPINTVKDSLVFFLGDHNFDIAFDNTSNSYSIIDTNSANYVINADMFNAMHDFLVMINCITYSDRINPANASVKKMLIEDMRDEIEYSKKHKNRVESIDNIGKAIVAICGTGNGSVNFIDIKQYKIFQILSTLKIDIKKLNAKYLMQGIYAGTVDSKKINKEELNWISL